MTDLTILTDAEYDQLTPVEKIDYWRRRYYHLENQYDELRMLCRERGELIARTREALNRT